MARTLAATAVGWLLVAGTALAAQTTGQIQGLVTDKEGRPLENVTVTLVGAATSGRPTTSDAHGEFRFYHLKPGTYTIWADERGPRVAWRSVGVRVGVTSHVTLTLRTPTDDDECGATEHDGGAGDEHAAPAPETPPQTRSAPAR